MMGNVPELHIHPDAIRHNLAVLRRHLDNTSAGHDRPRIWAVVKSDAYGHGLDKILLALDGADGLAVASADDARICRAAGWIRPVLLLAWEPGKTPLPHPAPATAMASEAESALMATSAPWVAESTASASAAITATPSSTSASASTSAQTHIVISRMDQLAHIQHSATMHDVHVWLRFAGMLNHAGLKANAYRQVWQHLTSLRSRGVIAGLGHMQHYAHAEDRTQLAAERRLFKQLIHDLPGPVCSENSASILNGLSFAATTQWVRSGIILYGVNPLGPGHQPELGLRPAMTLRAPIYAIQNLEPGDSIGYGCAARATRRMRVALVRCGYSHGYPRIVSKNCPCSVKGRPARLIGRVSMDTLSVDISPWSDISLGEPVTLWGDDGISIDRVAQAADTIPAQLFTAITNRVRRYYPGDHGYQAPRT